MNNEDINNGKKFDIVLMNPPYSDYSNTFLDIDFVKKINEISNKTISIHPAPRISSSKKNAITEYESGRCREIEIFKAYDIFKISPSWGYCGIFTFENYKKTDKLTFIYKDRTHKSNITHEELAKEYHDIFIDDNIVKLINNHKTIYDKLFEKYGNMCEDNKNVIYEENKHKKKPQKKLERVKKYLKERTYKYCIYKGSFNHDFDSAQEWNGEDINKLFNGQICWLTNKENVKNNIKYWLECPFFEVFRQYTFHLWKGVNGMAYKNLPAAPFDLSENEFKKWVNSLTHFTNEEIKAMIKFNIHNADEL